jgi:hypothetical protein
MDSWRLAKIAIAVPAIVHQLTHAAMAQLASTHKPVISAVMPLVLAARIACLSVRVATRCAGLLPIHVIFQRLVPEALEIALEIDMFILGRLAQSRAVAILILVCASLESV